MVISPIIGIAPSLPVYPYVSLYLYQYLSQTDETNVPSVYSRNKSNNNVVFLIPNTCWK